MPFLLLPVPAKMAMKCKYENCYQFNTINASVLYVDTYYSYDETFICCMQPCTMVIYIVWCMYNWTYCTNIYLNWMCITNIRLAINQLHNHGADAPATPLYTRPWIHWCFGIAMNIKMNAIWHWALKTKWFPINACIGYGLKMIVYH